jgi:catechol 2,3-dioxygenase-like lactoylglutathione lyase family enzyme
VQGRIDVPVGATLTHRHVALPVGEYTGTLRQPIMSVDVKRPVKINMIKINLGAAAEGGRPKKEPSGRIWLPGSLSVDMLSQCAYSYGVKIIKLAWVGTRTENFQSTVDFFRDVLGLRSELDLPGFRVLKLPDGSKVEVFGPDSDINRHFTTGPVAGFLVDDVRAAASELRSNRIEILLTEQDESGNAWVHFRAPDGNIYEFTQDPGVSRPL